MKKISILRITILLLLAIITILATFGSIYYPSVKDTETKGFSALNATKDIEVISREHHSVEHPEARMEVCRYLFGRLEELGGHPVIHTYDSVPDKIAGYANLHNIYAQFDPDSSEASSYVMLVAHYDSRYAQEVNGKTVYSYGAADDGYGVATALELVRAAKSYSHEWKQGIKILFTDAEESGMNGMKQALSHNREIFDSTSLVINIEARGVKGPALLFETSDGNSELMKLYSKADYPYTYSLTTLVYGMMPNFTDFSLIKDSIPGFNFSVLDNLDYYHTDKDNYSNISPRSIQHYGAQIEPMLHEFLTNGSYSDPATLRSERNSLFFTLPLIGLVSTGNAGWGAANIFLAIMICAVFLMYRGEWRIHAVPVYRYMGKMLLMIVISAVAGFAVSYAVSLASGAEYSFTGLKYTGMDLAASLIVLVITAAVYLAMFGHSLRYENIIGNGIFSAALSLLLYLAIGDNFFVMVPSFAYVMSLVLYRIIRSNVWFYLAFFITLLLYMSFCYILIVTLTAGCLPVAAVLFAMCIAHIHSLSTLIFCLKG